MSATLTDPEHEKVLHIAGMSCAACQIHVQRALESVPGVSDVSVDLMEHRARVATEAQLDPAALTAAVRRAGYDVVDKVAEPAQQGAVEAASAEANHSHLGLRALLALLAGSLAMVLSMSLMFASAAAPLDPLSRWLMRAAMPLTPPFLLLLPPEPVRWALCALALATMIFAAPEIYAAAWRAARHRATNMNTLVALGTLAAFAVSFVTTLADAVDRPSPMFGDVYYEAVVLILAFLLTGRWLEARARERAMRDVRAFAHEETGQGRWLGEGVVDDPASLLSLPETLMPIDALAAGDLLRVLPGDRVPVDAVVLAGASAVEESMITGEPLPITRRPGDRLIGGTLNIDGVLAIRTTAVGASSTRAQMQRLLERARSQRAPLQQLADRVSGIFVPVVLALAALTFLVWAWADNSGSHHLGFARALSLAIAVLVIACPCAMGLAVPAAVAVALGAGARAGILFKGGDALERLAAAQRMAFDKTGTLTEGKPRVVSFEPVASFPVSSQTLLSWAAAVEQLSTHPLATAVVDYASAQGATAAGLSIEGARVLPGIGAEGVIAGHHVALGGARLLQGVAHLGAPHKSATPMYLVVDGQLAATLYAQDELRASAAASVAALAKLHLPSILLTGDTAQTAEVIASRVGIADVRSRLMPADKVLAIENLQRAGLRVAMAGDGLNDAAALAQSDAGIAMASGTDMAREAGHVLLLRHDLALVPQAVRLARRTRRLMRQNLAWALVYNIVGLPLAAGVLLPHFDIALSPALASAAMACSSVSVLLNSLRLARMPRSPGPASPLSAQHATVDSGHPA